MQLQQRAADEPGKMPQSGSERLQAPPLPAYCGPTSARRAAGSAGTCSPSRARRGGAGTVPQTH